jgi:hypothetical protein
LGAAGKRVVKVKGVKGVKTRVYSGCGFVVLVEETAKTNAAPDIAVG